LEGWIFLLALSTKSFEIFCGTGGVGKTTLATARALSLAQKGLRVLLITIDPAKRLKDLLGLSSDAIGDVTKVKLEGVELSALLMSPQKTIGRMAQKYDTPDLAENRIVQILSKPYGGMNEILSLVEVQMQFDSGNFDVVVLDTPPGSHFLDFLEGLDKIRSFFDQNFIEIFSYLGQKSAKAGKRMFGLGIINRVVSAGVKKLLGYLQKVTGAEFIDDFIQAVQIIYQSRDAFLKGLSLQDKLKERASCNWFLVTSVEQGKAQEAVELKSHAAHFIHQDHFLVLNKCLEQELTGWTPRTEKLHQIKDSLENREQKLKSNLKQSFPVVLEFPEVISLSPAEHIHQLTLTWMRHAS
jgi:anion-transporting  ArsA/GET3 family ATPase